MVIGPILQRKTYLLEGYPLLVGGWTNPSEKYDRQIGNHFPRDRDEHNKYLSCHQVVICLTSALVYGHLASTKPPTSWPACRTCTQGETNDVAFYHGETNFLVPADGMLSLRPQKLLKHVTQPPDSPESPHLRHQPRRIGHTHELRNLRSMKFLPQKWSWKFCNQNPVINRKIVRNSIMFFIHHNIIHNMFSSSIQHETLEIML